MSLRNINKIENLGGGTPLHDFTQGGGWTAAPPPEPPMSKDVALN